MSDRRLDFAGVPGIVFLQNLSEEYMKIFQYLVFLLRNHKSPGIIRKRSYLGVLFPINPEIITQHEKPAFWSFPFVSCLLRS